MGIRGRSVQGASNFGGRSGSELIASSLPSTKSPVSWSVPTFTNPLLRARSYTP